MNINAETLFLGVIGNPIRHSLSPQLHNAVFSKMGMNAIYLPFAIKHEELEKALHGFQSLGFRGINVTVPFKEKVIQYLDELSDEARDYGAVNVIHFERGKMIGHNTDGRGFIESLYQEGVTLDTKAIIIGAGGAARSIVCALTRAGINEIEIFDIEAGRAEDLAKLASSLSNADIAGRMLNEKAFSESVSTAGLIVNCSPVGMYPNINTAPVASLKGIQADTMVVDIIYNPEETLLLKMARQEGCRIMNGISMFVYQAAFTQEILLGISPPANYMKEVVSLCLKES